MTARDALETTGFSGTPSRGNLPRTGPLPQVGRQIPLPAEPAAPRVHPRLGSLPPPRGSLPGTGTCLATH